ncbi:hypothetical protein MHTCC0001_03060 [Flavobacteriaceae bacterium MHTCC 0001]
MAVKQELMFYPSKCNDCGKCLINSKKSDVSIIDSEGKQRWQTECFAKALVPSANEMSVEEVMAEVLEDIDYYKDSGGGVTLSGGEVTIQPVFALELLKALKDAGIHTAIQTNLKCQRSVLEMLLPYLDLVMFDIKIMDDEAHRAWTGSSTNNILENAKWLSQQDVPTIVHTPVIPGFNNNKESIRDIAEFIEGFPSLLYYNLMPYNPLGADKYTALGMDYELRDTKTIKKEDMLSIKESLADYPFEVKIA